MEDDQRQHTRVRAQRLKVRVPDRAALQTFLRDVSEGGLYLKSATPGVPDEVLSIELLAPNHEEPLVLSGRVVRVESDGFAVKLESLEPEMLEQLAKLMNALAAAEPGAPAPHTLEEAKVVLAAVHAELLATRYRLDKTQKEIALNREFLARALAGANGPVRQGPGLGHAVFLGAGLVIGIVGAAALMVLRQTSPSLEPVGTSSRYQSPTPFDAGQWGGQRPIPIREFGTKPADAGEPPHPAKPVEASPPPGPAPVVADDSGHLNLKANAAAEVWLDGHRLGLAPQTQVSVKPGKHQIRFDCVGDAGRRTVGQPQTVEALPFADTDLDFDCQ